MSGRWKIAREPMNPWAKETSNHFRARSPMSTGGFVSERRGDECSASSRRTGTPFPAWPKRDPELTRWQPTVVELRREDHPERASQTRARRRDCVDAKHLHRDDAIGSPHGEPE